MKKNFWVLVAVVSCLFLGSVGCEYSKTMHVVDASKEADEGYHPLNDPEDEILPEEEAPATPTETAVVPNDPAPDPLPEPTPLPAPTPQPTRVLPSQPAAVAEAPHVTSVTPSVSGDFITTMVSITFSEPMDKTSVTEAFAVVILPTDGDVATCFNGGKWEKTFVNDSATEFTLLFTEPLEGCTFTGIVSGRVKSKEGIAMGANYTWSFALKDVTAPEVLHTTPYVTSKTIAPTNTVSVMFSEPMDPDAVKIPLNVFPDSGADACFNGGDVLSSGWSEGNTKFSIRYSKPLAACAFTAIVSPGVADASGNRLDSVSGYQWKFTIGN